MKISVSLDEQDVEFLDAYAREHGPTSRSAAVAAAIRALREAELVDSYASAFEEWAASGEAARWESTVGDGLGGER